jgi:hypothetical protein
MNKSILTLTAAVTLALGSTFVHGAELVPVIFDGEDEGYNDTTPATPIGGNPGTTLGEQRRIVAQFAADLWGAVLVSEQPVFIGAQFNPLGANVLGSAGATSVHANFAPGIVADTWYSSALADAISGIDQNPGVIDINSQFSSDFNFYYGLDDNTPVGTINFLDVVMHEYGHGLGFQNFENEANGTFLSGRQDIYSVFTFDNTTGKFWTEMTIAERRASAINDGNVVFTGASATAGAKLILDPLTLLRVTAPAGIADNYRFGAASFGPTPTSANFNGSVVLATDGVGATNDGCEPLTNGGAIDGNVALIDRGTCAFTIKVKNAQNAGATAVIIADNAPGQPAGLGGADPTITIPSLRITRNDGITFKANLPGVQVGGFVVDPTRLTGADANGRPQLFMPPVVQSGSSGSHYDSVAVPNLLMEPSINGSLFAAIDLDISPNLLQDTGWTINSGNAVIDGCDTGIDVVTDTGIIIGANVQASSNLCLAGATNRGSYQSCMDTYTTNAVASGILTDRQKGKVMSCAAKVGKTKK